MLQFHYNVRHHSGNAIATVPPPITYFQGWRVNAVHHRPRVADFQELLTSSNNLLSLCSGEGGVVLCKVSANETVLSDILIHLCNAWSCVPLLLSGWLRLE